MNITNRSNRNGVPRRIEKRARTGAAQDAEALINNCQSESQSASDDSYEIVTLEMESRLPTRDRPDTVRGLLVAETDHYYRIVDALGAHWTLPKHKWKLVKREVRKK